jgi:hypothetical protein
MLRLPWQDPVEGPMLVRTVRKVHHCSWHNIHLLAEVIATVSGEHGWVGSTIGDMVLESLRTDLEFPANRRSSVACRTPSSSRSSSTTAC